MLKTPVIDKSVVGSGEWRISYDKDGDIVAIELWDHAGGASPVSYDCLRISR